MSKQILGIHHVTAIAGQPQQNLDFYTEFLGLRLVKLTVNFDDPETYHFYFGDGEGRPGSILTFFPWPGAPNGRQGTGQLTVTSFSIPEGALEYWIHRLKAYRVDLAGSSPRFEEQVLQFRDPDGLRLELVAHAAPEARSPWDGGPVPAAHAIRGFHSVTLSEANHERTAPLLTGTLGFHLVAQAGDRFRYQAGASFVDVLHSPHLPPGRVAVGTVHHIAWRTPDEAAQHAWREEIATLGLNVTGIVDRKYFRSIYFREPGGVLFEIATDPPGFTVDESLDELGTRLALPPWLEPRRTELARRLPPLRLPQLATT